MPGRFRASLLFLPWKGRETRAGPAMVQRKIRQAQRLPSGEEPEKGGTTASKQQHRPRGIPPSRLPEPSSGVALVTARDDGVLARQSRLTGEDNDWDPGVCGASDRNEELGQVGLQSAKTRYDWSAAWSRGSSGSALAGSRHDPSFVAFPLSAT